MTFSKLRPYLLALLPSGVISRRKRKRAEITARQTHAEFRKRNSRAKLEQSEVLTSDPLPEVPAIIDDYDATRMAANAIAFADRSGLLDFLKAPRSLADITVHYGYRERQTKALLELLTAAKITESSGEHYLASAAARIYLMPDSPLYLGDHMPASFITAAQMSSEDTPGAVALWRSGESHQQEVWARSMHEISFKLGFALANTGILKDAKQVTDIAGGAGSMCIALALKNPELTGTVLELPDSAAVASRMVERYELSSRIECRGGDMFADDWPENNDAVLFTNIFHDWSPADCAKLARKAHAALRPGGRALIIEALLDETEPGPLWVSNFSLNMAFNMYGQQFRRSELEPILSEGGFATVTTKPLFGYYSMIVAEKAA